jgi:hypothetical protein
LYFYDGVQADGVLDMTSLSYTSGTTANLVAGGTANMVDITGPLSDWTTYINGAHLDSTTNIAASPFASYLTVAKTGGRALNMGASGTFYYQIDGTPKATTATTLLGVDLIPFDPADYTLGGRTLKLRLEAISYAAGGQTNTFTWGLYPVTVAGGTDVLAVTLGSVTAGSTVARANPVTQTTYRDVGSDFTAPVAGTYVLGFTTTASVGSTTALQSVVRLQARWV